MSASDTALRLVSAAVIASLKSGMEPRDPCGVDFDYFLEFFSALLRDLRCKVGVYPRDERHLRGKVGVYPMSVL